MDGELAILAADRGLAGLLAVWQRAWATNSQTVPARVQLDPCDFPKPILPFMFIYERADDRFRCRLYGTKMREIFGSEATGRYLDQMVTPQSVARRHALFNRVLETGLPLFYRGFLVPAGRDWRGFHRLLLPATISPGQRPTQVLGAVRVFDPPAGQRPMPDDPDALLGTCDLTADDLMSPF